MIEHPRHLGLSIRRWGKDEIEIRPSLFGGYFRGLLRTLILASLCVIWGMDRHHGQTPFVGMYEKIKRDYIWAFDPDQEIRPLYKGHIANRQNPEFIRMFPNEKILPYPEYRELYLKGHFWAKLKIVGYGIVFSLLLFLFFLPGGRGLRLNRKERLIYIQSYFGHQFVPVPDRGDPLAGLNYNIFGPYMFGWGRHFSLMINTAIPSEKSLSGWFGVYPTPSRQHNADLVRAMRAFFNEENPEFLKHVGRFYKIPWLHPLIFLCNGFAPALRFSRKKADRAIARFQQEWQRTNAVQKSRYFTQEILAQKKVNEDLRYEARINSVED